MEGEEDQLQVKVKIFVGKLCGEVKEFLENVRVEYNLADTTDLACLIVADLHDAVVPATEYEDQDPFSDVKVFRSASKSTVGSAALPVMTAFRAPSKWAVGDSTRSWLESPTSRAGSKSPASRAGSKASVASVDLTNAKSFKIIPAVTSDTYRLESNVIMPEGSRVEDLRECIGRARNWTREKIDKMRFFSRSTGGGYRVLADHDIAQEAQSFYISRAPSCGKSEGASASRNSLLNFQRELIGALWNLELSSTHKLRETQAKIFPKYGFQVSPQGIQAMHEAFEAHMPDRELLWWGDLISGLMKADRSLYDIVSWTSC